RPYRELLRYTLQDHDADPGPKQAATVLRASDRLRARALSERLARGPSAEGPGDEATAALRARVSWLARRAQGLEDEDDTPSPMLLEELRHSEQRLLEQVRRQRLAAGDSPANGPSGPSRDALDVEALRGALGESEALLEYGLLDDELFACIVRPGGVSVRRRLAIWPDVLQALQAVQFQLDALGHGAMTLQAHLPTLTARCEARLQRLHALVWAPLADGLQAVRRVLVVAPPALGSLPFPALTDGQWALVEQHEFAWAPSGASAARSLRRAAAGAPQHAFVLGESSHLPHAGDEARAVAAGFAAATLRLDAEATVDTLRSEAAGQADLLHLACHAQFRADSPSFSALHLHDGALTAEQVEALRLAARVVVLSGCETAGRSERASAGHDPNDRAAGGDEWVGLVRAFLLAGAARVVASLWPVDDHVTGEFMVAFYRALAGGAAPARALQQAQQALRRAHPHPFHWAAFALYGGW
ncbi:MAG TPA: CHAT domain-containing protein, partial [Ideonella sp.]|nr:CHAT domain-containing protein [Ideonella sp.]